MFVDPDKPLPLPGEKKDTLGSVLEAIIEIGNSRVDAGKDVASFEKTIDEASEAATVAIAKLNNDFNTSLLEHTNRRGVVHGETKVTVGLGNKENWPMASPLQMDEATANDVFCYPAGLKGLVQSKLSIDPSNYLRGRLIPIASGGQLGNVPQWPFSWKEGEIIQSFQDPMAYYTETPWQFSTDQGVQIYPAMNGSDILTQVTPDQGRERRAVTQWGGTAIRVYNGQLDLRRTRPSLLRGESNAEPNNQLIKGSTHLFDKHSVFYMESNWVGVRSYNKVRLPFDILNNNGISTTNWSGIIESRENFIYNIFCHMERGNIGGYGDDLYLIIELDIWNYLQNGIVVKDGPGRPAETIAYLGDRLNTFTYNLPASNKIRKLVRQGKPDAVCIKLGDILGYTAAQREDLALAANKAHSTHIAFYWRNRLNGEFVIRVPMGFYSKDRQYYTNYYMDLSCQVREDLTNKSAVIVVNTLRDITASIQMLNANLQVTTQGRFVQYPALVDNDIFHPLIFDGVFESLGGHIKTYTLYNRQYVGYYQHNVTGTGDWIARGDIIKPVLTKYNYKEMSTLNNDGMYGDHLRHIPLAIVDGKIEYLTYTRDWLMNYRWAIAKVQQDTTPEMLTPTGHHMGPWREGVSWIKPDKLALPSFLVVNSEAAAVFEVNCLVFNKSNDFKGYARYQYDVSNLAEPISFLDPVTLSDNIISYISGIGGGWLNNYKQMFYFKNRLYFFSQCTGYADFPANGIDCYYGWIDGAYIQTDPVTGAKQIAINGTPGEKVVYKPLKVNNKASLNIPASSIVGYNELNATDTYLMLMERNGLASTYQLMVNLAPFNNFYFEFRLSIDDQAGTTDLIPNPVAVDPVFPYDPNRGYNVNYDSLIAYATKTPHRFHVNYQTPVMLKKSMWSFRKTPGTYGIFAQSIGTSISHGGLMNSIAGVSVYPVGSTMTVGGSNIVIKAPVNASEDFFEGSDELLARLTGTGINSTTGSQVDLYGVKHNPNGYEIEPNSGIVPCGFLKNSIFYHYDPDGWRNDLLPVIDGKRMNFYGYGSSFPAFMGVYGSGLPINRFFLTERPTIMSWNTAVGRQINVGVGTNIRIVINDVQQTYSGGGTFTIPNTFTGVVIVQITSNIKITWGAGLTVLSQIGNTVNQLDFSGSDGFTINAPLPKRITNLSGLFRNAKGASYPGIETWDISAVTDLSFCFMYALNFNHNIQSWITTNVETMEGMFNGASSFNQAIGRWDVRKVLTMAAMFNGAVKFNQSLNTWSTYRVNNFSRMFMDAFAFNGNIGAWNTSTCSNYTSMFENATSFNIDISAWDVSGAVRMDNMFSGATAFNSNLNTWNVAGVTTMRGMFKGAIAFSRNISGWVTSRVTNTLEMFANTVLFGKDNTFTLNTWDMSKVKDATRMFYNSGFDSEVVGWKFSENAILTQMFASSTFTRSIATWDVSNVLSADQMFALNKVYQANMDGLVWQSCLSFESMFFNTNFNGSVANWKFSNIFGISMDSMFESCAQFTGIGVDTWNVGGVSHFGDLFRGCPNFSQDLSKWDVSFGTNFNGTFIQCAKFNSDISKWDVSSATEMNGTFTNASIFNQDLSGWKVSNVTTHIDFALNTPAWTLPKPSFPA